MSDLISRKAAIEALQEHRNLFCDNTPETFSKLSYAEKSRVDELDIDEIKEIADYLMVYYESHKGGEADESD